MRRGLIWIVFLVLFGACQVSNRDMSIEQRHQVESEVQRAFEGLSQAAQTLDHERYFSFFDRSDLTILNADGSILDSYSEFQQTYQPQLEYIQKYNHLKFDPVTIDVIDENNAVLVNAYIGEVVLVSGDVLSVAGAGTQVWSKRTGEWKLVHVTNIVRS